MTYPFQQSDGGQKSSSWKGIERLDCTVVALAHAADVSYDAAHSLLQSAGRTPRHGFPFGRYVAGLNLAGKTANGYKIREIPNIPWRTVNQLMKYQLPARLVVKTGRHVFAVVNGTVLDRFQEGGKRRVYRVWVFEKALDI